MIPRRGGKSKIFLSVVIYVVKSAFVPFSATGGNPANAGVARLCGVFPYPVPDTATAHPNAARYQLRYTPIVIKLWSCKWSNLWSSTFLTAVFCFPYRPKSARLKGFLRFSLSCGVKTVYAPKAGALPTAQHPVMKLGDPAGRILPNQARYQLRYTRIKICRPHPGGISTIPAFFLACKGKICLGAFCIPGAFPPPPDYSPRAAFRAPTRSVFSQATPRSSRPIWP